MKSKRQLQIDAYIAQNECKLPGTLRVIVKGVDTPLEVFRLPIDLLIFNIGNGRFASELIAEERKLKRQLDPTNKGDEEMIQQYLLEQKEDETEALEKDLRERGQLDPGIITNDGAVINANRRMAILKKLYEDTEDEKYQYLKVARLPKGVDEKNLWKIEANLQFGRDFRLEYGAVNELLKIRTGKDSGLKPKEISLALAGRYSPTDVENRLEVLKLIDIYLDSIGKPGEYQILTRGKGRVTEHFHSLNGVIRPLKKGAHKNEIPKTTKAAFAMIRGGKHKHWDIRKLRRIIELKPARTELYKMFNKSGEVTGDVENAFSSAQLEVELRDQRDKPEKLATNAFKSLKEIETKHEAISSRTFQELLRSIRRELDRLSATGVGSAKKKRQNRKV